MKKNDSSDIDRNEKETFNIYEYDVSSKHLDDLKDELDKIKREVNAKTKKLREKKKECEELIGTIRKLSEKMEEDEEIHETNLKNALTKVHKYEELYKQMIQTLAQCQDKILKEREQNILLLDERDTQHNYIQSMKNKYASKIADCNKLHAQYIDLKENYDRMKEYDPTCPNN
jgi:hypothetical protein